MWLKSVSATGASLKTTSELSFDWSPFLAHIRHKQLLDHYYIHAGDIFKKKVIMVHNKTAESHQVGQDNSALDHQWQLVLCRAL